jgi:YbbR domain-containing protein
MSRKFKNWFTHNFFLKVISLALAIFVWLYVNGLR